MTFAVPTSYIAAVITCFDCGAIIAVLSFAARAEFKVNRLTIGIKLLTFVANHVLYSIVLSLVVVGYPRFLNRSNTPAVTL